MTWWSEKLAEGKKPLPPPAPYIPPPQPEPDTVDDLIEQARASVARPDPALGVLSTPTSLFGERQTLRPGADVGTTSRRPGPAAEAPADDLLGLTPYEKAQLVILGTKAGRFEGSEAAKAAHDRAAQVQELVNDKAWTVTEDTVPRRASSTRIAGATWRRP